jgi:hypothetical protein
MEGEFADIHVFSGLLVVDVVAAVSGVSGEAPVSEK